jgi:hypothetical protein
MTEKELRELAASVEDLKRAVQRSNPQLRAMMTARGWVPMSALAGLGVALFCLPAQVLVVAYGSFAAIPAAFRTALWCVIVLVLVLSGVSKLVLLTRKAAEVEKNAGLGTVTRAFFMGQSFHIGVPYIFTIVGVSAFAVYIGHPWYVVPAVVIPTCFWSNFIATIIDRPVFKATGWWSLLSGLASLFWMEQAPFIWLFVTLGGLCFLFAGTMYFAERRERAETR